MKAIWLDFNLARMGLTRLTGRLSRHAYWGPLSPLRYGDRPEPTLPGDQWVRCRTLLGGICGSDLAAIQLRQPANSILRPYVSYPLMLGHENVAEVVEVGAAADAAWVGRRVCVDPTLACLQRGIDPPCKACAGGRFGECENFTVPSGEIPPGSSIGYNSRTGGSWGEYFVAHQSQLVAVPANVETETAIVVDPLACAMHGVLRAMPKDDDQVLVVGAGAIGLGVVAALRALGSNARIIVDARHEYQAEAAIRMGANQAVSSGRPGSRERFEHLAEYAGSRVAKGLFGARVLAGGFDIVYDCVGSTHTVQDALRTARPGGKVVLLGTGTGRGADWTGLWFRELDVLGAYGRQIETWEGRQIGTYQLVLELISAGKIKCDSLLTHTFALADYRKAFAAVTAKRSSGVIKAAFKFSQEKGSP
ncbi:MAG: alcohol dehydrogenase catalytic domain-containing protein [Phycisphaerae bacterium]|nr:alcohol dehydrogenase catalytic domain-containing protein [Phycisphaerae bacterium]